MSVIGAPWGVCAAAARHAHRPLLKIKLGTADDMARLEAVRAGAPDARIIVDANEGWSAEVYSDLAPHLVRLGVALVEQPLPAGSDDMLAEIERPLPVCADESCHDRASLPDLVVKYDMGNVKLDKAGGLTEALALKEAARAHPLVQAGMASFPKASITSIRTAQEIANAAEAEARPEVDDEWDPFEAD